LTAVLEALADDRDVAPDLAAIFDAVGLGRASWRASAERADDVPPLSVSPYRGVPTADGDRVVRLWNDDTTTQGMVVEILTGTFGRSPAEARYLMLRTHHLGSAAFGAFTADDAERLVTSAIERARAHDHPLRITIEPRGVPSRPRFLGLFSR
jgi:ATP-dependent Clp protease adaptor protein ClpS